ncbi:unnamed protein product [Ambrosiozyma monospora]|uniref:Unnamed protein product n=1 Tax=Ambrosiozyma monospora TaxID=43982 RepID=A0ACB5SWJ2_AMBMO|nr:unnamed protein product [Ambrosiozyma monospora]
MFKSIRLCNLLVQYRGYTTVSTSVPTRKGLLTNSIHEFRRKLRDREQFTFNLLNKNIQEDFYLKATRHFNDSISQIKTNVVDKGKVVKLNKDDILKGFQTPTESITPSLIDILIHNQDDLTKLPIKTSEKTTLEDVTNEIVEKLVYNRMKPHCLQHTYNDASNIQNFNNNLTFNIMDIDNPYEWFPKARRLKRKFIMHVGPTNSGKTYNALKKLEVSSKGYYAGPLRLLAREVYDKFQNKGIRCNLVTGEEVIVDVDEFGNKAGLTSGTIEMISMNDHYDVVVVDEIQMLGDEFRGSAWTNTILGVNANEIHLCGEAAAVPLVEKLVASTGDDLVINEYKRLGKLVVDDEPIGMGDFQKGDCLVCFSKNNILKMKKKIEERTNLKCATIYGALPPETRAQEAQRFNDGYYDVVIASDAIGMGLNLKINRVIFTQTEKYDGKEMVPLTDSNIKQIGGRAGRFGVGESVGHITAIGSEELESVKIGIEAPIKFLDKAVLFPPDSLWVRYYSMFAKNTQLSTMYHKFESDVKKLYQRTNSMKRDFEIQRLADRTLFADFIDKNRLSKNFLIVDQLRVAAGPTNLKKGDKRLLPIDILTQNIFKQFMLTIAYRNISSLFDYKSIPFYLIGELQNTEDMSGKVVGLNGPNGVPQDPVPANMKNKVVGEIMHNERNKYLPKRRYTKRLDPVEERLRQLEQFHKMIGIYLWLSYRFPQNFVDIESTIKLKELVEYRITQMLGNLKKSDNAANRLSSYSRKQEQPQQF